MKKALVISAMILAGVILITLIRQPHSPATAAVPQQHQFNFGINITPYIPIELKADATPEELVSFAWNEFFAVNWKSSWKQTGTRGNPDNNWSYVYPGHPYPDDPLVWETYAHRTELRPYNDSMLPFDKFPKYVYKDQPEINNTNYLLFNNLDENNEIGSCELYADTRYYNKDRMVLYQAKVNRDEYEYLLNTYPKAVQLKEALDNTVRNISRDSAYYRGAKNSCNCPDAAKVFCLPCGGAFKPGGAPNAQYTGAIEVKTAWKPVFPAEEPLYFTRTVITYQKVGDKVYAQNRRYGLIGMHIIHKTQNYPNFIFATFEHVGVQQSNMGYVELRNGPFNPVPQAYNRLHPIPPVVDSSTAHAHRLLRLNNPNSIWQYYRLVGVQGNPTNDSTSFSYFLANYVIESDPTLADFHGSSINNPFNYGVNNVQRGRGYRMGGCQGCHGVTQVQLGSDCSFLMNFVDKPFESPDAGRRTSKIEIYRKALK
ncbi:hypothetical protein [Chitinophaga solisilvae]|uniref:hypothetical protein n=1 Tax=Chitinophaga solisilvae TaxID=1233460 RepID=UPI0013706E5B|nr:hypothetical protein [Chitinophaga solisilvae]